MTAPGGATRTTRTIHLSLRRRVLLVIVVLTAAVVIAAIASGTIGPRPAGGVLGAFATGRARSTPAAISATTASPTTVATRSPARSPRPSQIVHKVKAGESLISIGARYGVTPQAIRRANHLKDANLLRIGQKLIIPKTN
jgi:LysM repeat protein